MKLYISFGQEHTHRVNGHTFDKDSIAEIECKNYTHGREIAFKLFSGKFGTSYTEDNVMESGFMNFFPRGIKKVN